MFRQKSNRKYSLTREPRAWLNWREYFRAFDRRTPVFLFRFQLLSLEHSFGLLAEHLRLLSSNR